MKAFKYRKLISSMMIITLLVFGMCFNLNVETRSVSVCPDEKVFDMSVVSSRFIENTTISSNICAASIQECEMYENAGEQSFLATFSRRMSRSNTRVLRCDVQIQCVSSVCILLFFYFMLWEVCPNLYKTHNNILVAGYLHQVDGKKYAF